MHGVEVLNINELANALKPIVLPGELMRVFILKEGKEYNQGVAYLDDGTMVVVDNAQEDDLEDHRYFRDERSANHCGQDDLRPVRRPGSCGSRQAAAAAKREHVRGSSIRMPPRTPR